MTLRAFVLLATTAVAACGGGYKETATTTGGGGTTPPPPTTTVTPAAIRLFASSAQMLATADTQAEGDTLTAVVTDANSNTISGAIVTFAITSGNGAIIVTQGTTDSTGTATAVLTTGGDATFPRTIAVTATAGTVTSTPVSVSVVDPAAPPVTPASISGISMFASAAQLFDDADTAAEGVTLTAVVTNAQGNVVSGVPVSFAVTTGPAALVVSRDTTDSSGTAVAILTTNGVRTARNVTITASVTSGSTTFSSPVTLPVIGHATKIVGTITGLRLNQSGSLTVTARAEDSVGNPVGNVPVTFAVTAGAVTPATMTTNASGATVNPAGGNSATVTAGAAVAPGSIIHITMTAPGATADSLDIQVVADVASIRLRPANANLKADADTVAEGLTVTAVVADASGALLEGERVNFSLAKCDNTGASTGGVTPGAVTSDASGNASAVVTTGGDATFPRTINVRAISGAFCSFVTLNVVDPNTPATPPGNVSKVSVFASASQLLADADTPAEGVTITALATDSAGNTLSGVDVGFSVTTSNGVLQVSRGTTDSTGTATAILTTGGNTAARNITVQASVPSATTPTATVTLPVVGHASTIIGSLSSLQLPSDDSVPVLVHAKAVDDSGNLVPNVPVTFYLSSGAFNPTPSGPAACTPASARCIVLTTDSTGQTVDATISTGAVVTPRTITVTMTAPNANAATADVRVTSVSSQVGSVTMTLGNLTPIADGASQTAVRATVTDAAGQPVNGATVLFSATAGTIAASGVTNSSGVVQVLLTSPLTSGTATIRARSGGFDATQDITYVPGAPSSLVISASRTLVPFGQTAVLRVTVKDANNNLVPNQAVSFDLPTNSSGASLGASSAFTNALGIATTTYQAGQVGGADTVSASVSTAGVSPQTIGMTASSTGIAQNLTLSASSSSIPADNTSTATLTATLTDTGGQPLAGQALTFTTSAGSMSLVSATTAADGTFVARLKAGTVAGRAIVTVRHAASGLSAAVPVTLTAGPAATVALTVAPGTVRPGGTASLGVTVLDANSNPVSGEFVSLSVATNTSGGVIASTALTTDANGRASTTYNAGPTVTGATPDVLQAQLASGASNTANLDVNAAAAQIASMALTVGDLEPVADTSTYTVVRAVVTDTAGNLVNGASVAFSSTAGAFSSTPGTFTAASTATTDTTGTAQLFLQSPATAGSAIVRASTGGFTVTQPIAFVAGAPNTVVLSATPQTITFGKVTTLRATVTDANGNLVPDETVTFKVTANGSAGVLGGAAVATDASGAATTSWQAGAAAFTNATDSFSASVSKSGVAPGTTSVTVSATSGTVSVTSAAASIVADNVSGKTTINTTVLNQDGDPVSGATVTCTTSAGSIAPTSTTGGSGIGSNVLTASNTTGNAVVVCGVPGLTASTVVQFVAGPAKTIALTASPTTVSLAGTSTLTATVFDVHNNVVSGEPVSFSTEHDTGNSTLSAAGGTTDANGVVTLLYTAGTIATQTDTVTASTAGGATGGTVDITTSATTQVANTLNLAVGGSASVEVATTVGVRATLLDTAGQPISGQTVTFTNSGGGSLSSGSAVTDASGHADVTFTTPNFATTNLSISASSSGLLATANITIIPGAPDATKSSITANPSTLIADGTSTTTITVILNDAQGNPVLDGRQLTLLSSTNAGTFTPSNTSTTASGRATFTLTSPSSSSVTDISVQDLPTLSAATVTFASPTANTTGDPASISSVASTTNIAVAGVGQTEQLSITATVRDSAGNVIDESNYPAGTNNLRAEFITQPHGGETITGKDATGAIVSSSSGSQFVDVATTGGVAVLTLHSGTLPGSVAVKFSVLNFTGTSFTVPADVATTGSLPQISIASGPPHTIVFTHPVTNSITNLGGGTYQRRGQALVTDRFGNNVPDGTVVNFTMMDSVIAQDDTGTIAAGSANLDNSAASKSLLRRECTVAPGPDGGEAGTCNARATLSVTRTFNSTLTRNNAQRGIQANDNVYILNANGPDKVRKASTVVGPNQITVQDPYVFTATAPATAQPTAGSGQYWVGSSLSGSFILGCSTDDTTDATTGCTDDELQVGTGVTFKGIAGFRVRYPANVGSILTGCYGYNAGGSFHTNEYIDLDRRDQVPQSRQVVIAAGAGTGATGVNAGEFCFAPVAGSTLTPIPSEITVSVGSPQVVSLELRDGGDTVLLPYVPISCYVSSVTLVTGSGGVFAASVNPDTDGDSRTNVFGIGSVTISVSGTPINGDSARVTCTTTGNFEAASHDISVTVQ